MRELEPTYLRYVFDELNNGSISSDNSSSLPYGFVGIFEKEFSSDISSVERSKLLKRLALWSLLKRPVSTNFYSKLLNEDEDLSKQLIDRYSNWFNSPEPGKYVLFHDRLRVFLLQKLSNHEINELNEQIISYLEGVLNNSFGDESESYALEHLTHHMLVESQMNREYDRLTDYTNNNDIWSRQINQSNEFKWSQKGIQDSIKESARRHIEIDLISSVSNSLQLKRREESDAESIFQYLKKGEHEIAFSRVNSIAEDKRFRLFILMIYELTNGILNNIDQKLETCERVLKQFSKLKIDKIPFNIIDSTTRIISKKDEITQEIIFKSIVELKEMELDYSIVHNKYKHFNRSISDIIITFDNNKINISLEFIKYIRKDEHRFESYIKIFNQILYNHIELNNGEKNNDSVSNEQLIKTLLREFYENLNDTYKNNDSYDKSKWMSKIFDNSDGYTYKDSFKKSDLINLCNEFINNLINGSNGLNVFNKVDIYARLFQNNSIGEDHQLIIVNKVKEVFNNGNFYEDNLAKAYIKVSNILLYANDLSASNEYFKKAIIETDNIIEKRNNIDIDKRDDDPSGYDEQIKKIENQLLGISLNLISRFTFLYVNEDQINGDKSLNFFKKIFLEIMSISEYLDQTFINYAYDYDDNLFIPSITNTSNNLEYLENLIENLLKADEVEKIIDTTKSKNESYSPIYSFVELIDNIYSAIYDIIVPNKSIKYFINKHNNKYVAKQLMNRKNFEEAYLIDPNIGDLKLLLIENINNPDFVWIQKYKDELINSCLNLYYYDSLIKAGLNDKVKKLEENYLIELDFHKNPGFDSYFKMAEHWFDDTNENILESFSIMYNYNREQSKDFIYPNDNYYVGVLVDMTPRIIFGLYLKLGEASKAESFISKIKETSTRSWCQFVMLNYYIKNELNNYEESLEQIDNYFIKIYGFIIIIAFYYDTENPKYSKTLSKLLRFISSQKCEFRLSKSYLILSAFLIEIKQFENCLDYYERIKKEVHKNDLYARLSLLEKNDIEIIYENLKNKKLQNEIKVGIKDSSEISNETIFDDDLKDRNYIKLIDNYIEGLGKFQIYKDSSESDKIIDKTTEYYSRIIKESFKEILDDVYGAEDVSGLLVKLVEVAKKNNKPNVAIETLDFISENIDYLNNKTYYKTTYAGADKILDFLYEKGDQEYIDFIFNKYPDFGNAFDTVKEQIKVWKPEKILKNDDIENIDNKDVYGLMIKYIGSNNFNYAISDSKHINYLIENNFVNKLTVISDIVKDDKIYNKLSKLLINNNKLDVSLIYANKISDEEIKFETICYIIKNTNRLNEKIKFNKLIEELKKLKMIGNQSLYNLSIAFLESSDIENAVYFGDLIFDATQETVKASLIYDSSETIIKSCITNNDYEIEEKTKPIIEKYFKDYNNEWRTLYLEEIYEIESIKIVFAIIEIIKNKKGQNIQEIYTKYCEHLIALYYKSNIVNDLLKVKSCIKLSKEFRDFKMNDLSEKFISDSINHRKNIVLLNGEGGFAPNKCPEHGELEAYIFMIKYLYEINHKDLKIHIDNLSEFFTNNFSKIIKYWMVELPAQDERNIFIDELIGLIEILDLKNSDTDQILEFVKPTITFINKLLTQKKDEKIIKLSASVLTFNKINSSLLEKSVQWAFEIIDTFYKKDDTLISYKYDSNVLEILTKPISKNILNEKSVEAYKKLIKEKILKRYSIRKDRLDRLLEINAPSVIFKNEIDLISKEFPLYLDYQWYIFKFNYENNKDLKPVFIDETKNRQITSEEEIGKINDDNEMYINIDEDLISTYYYKLFELYMDNGNEKCYDLIENIVDYNSVKLLLEKITSKHSLKDSLNIFTKINESIPKDFISSILSKELGKKRVFDDDFYIFLSKYNNSIEEFEKLLTYILNTKMMYSKKVDKQNIDLLLEVIDIGELKDRYSEL